MKIMSLTAENIKKLKAIEIKPDSNIVQITGRNAQGKTSVLDCIWYALGGKDAIDVKPIRNGQEKAIIKIDIDEFVVTRTFKDKNGETTTSLSIENKQGLKYPSPQSMLDSIIGKLTFDPLAFSRMKPRDQFDKLKEIAEIDFDFEEYTHNEKQIYNERTAFNKEIKQLETEINSIVINEKLGKLPVDTSKLMREIAEIEGFNREQENAINKKQRLAEKIIELEEELEIMKENYNSISFMPLKSVEEFKQQITQSSLINENVNKIKLKKEKEIKLKTTKEQTEQRTRILKEMMAIKNSIIQNAKMPIEGLTIEEGQVIYNQIPLSQASGAEQLKVSLAIAMAANPKLKVIRITDGSLLDDVSMNELTKIAQENDYQIWIERVDSSGTVGVFIEDGEIK
jgi:hypothetical protein